MCKSGEMRPKPAWRQRYGDSRSDRIGLFTLGGSVVSRKGWVLREKNQNHKTSARGNFDI